MDREARGHLAFPAHPASASLIAIHNEVDSYVAVGTSRKYVSQPSRFIDPGRTIE